MSYKKYHKKNIIKKNTQKCTHERRDDTYQCTCHIHIDMDAQSSLYIHMHTYRDVITLDELIDSDPTFLINTSFSHIL